MKYLSLLSLSICFLLGCNYDYEYEDTLMSPRPWVDMSAFSGAERAYLNSSVQGDSLTVMSIGLLGFVRSTDTILNGMAFIYTTNSIYEKNAFSKDIFTLKNNNSKYMNIRFTRDFWCHNNNCLSMGKWTTFLKDFDRFNTEYDNGAFNSNNNFLTSYLTTQDQEQIRLLFFKTKPYDQFSYEQGLVDTPSVLHIKLPKESSVLVKRIQSVGQYFYVSTNEKSYRIKEDGTYKVIFDKPFTSIFDYKNEIYADLGDAVFVSKDSSETWQKVRDGLDETDFRQYCLVADRLICYHNENNLDEIILPNFNLKTISNQGMENRRITSLTEFKDKVYVTTLNGLFVKPKTAFFN
jgi:hypothetical protein